MIFFKYLTLSAATILPSPVKGNRATTIGGATRDLTDWRHTTKASLGSAVSANYVRQTPAHRATIPYPHVLDASGTAEVFDILPGGVTKPNTKQQRPIAIRDDSGTTKDFDGVGASSPKRLLRPESVPEAEAALASRQLQTTGSWAQLGTDVYGNFAHEGVGTRLALSGDSSVLVASAKHDGSPGLGGQGLTVYEWSQSGYIERFVLDLGLNAHTDMTHISLSHDGSTLAVGISTWAYPNLSNGIKAAGVVFVYVWNGTHYEIPESQTPLVGTLAEENFGGQAVELSNNGQILAVGQKWCRRYGNAAYVRIFEWDGSKFSQIFEIPVTMVQSDPQNRECHHFAWGMAMSNDGSVIATADSRWDIGNHHIHDNHGTVYIFERTSNSDTYVLRHQLFGGTTPPRLNFGYDLSFSGNGEILAVADSQKFQVYQWNDSNGSYELRGSDIVHNPDFDGSGPQYPRVDLSENGNILATAPMSPYFEFYFWNGNDYVQMGTTGRISMGTRVDAVQFSLSGNGNVFAIGQTAATYDDVINRGMLRVYTFDGALPSMPVLPLYRSPTSAPTHAPWDIIYVNSTFDLSVNSVDELVVEYEVGKGRIFNAIIYAKGCGSGQQPIDVDYGTSHTSVDSNSSASMSKVTINYDFNMTTLVASNMWNNVTQQVQLCHILQLLQPLEGQDDLVIAQDVLDMKFDVNMYANFSASVGLAPQTVNESNDTVAVDSFVDVFHCNELGEQLVGGATLGPNDAARVCLGSKSDDVLVHEVKTMVVKQGGEQKLAVIEDGSPTIPAITTLEHLADIKTHLVTTRVPSNVVVFAEGQSIDFEGTLVMKLGSSERRQLNIRRTLQAGAGSDPVDDDQDASFQLSIDLKPDESAVAGAEVGLLTSSSHALTKKVPIILGAAFTGVFALSGVV